MIKIMSSGVFDVLNLGHINILAQAKKIGDYLVVGIQDDDSVKKAKGQLPILNINERVSQIEALPFVDEIVVYNDIDQRNLWDKIKPNIIVQGDDYIHSGDRTNALKYFKENNIRLVLLPRTQGISSSEIKRRIIHGSRKDFDHLLKNIELLHIDNLSVYENFDLTKVEKLESKIKNDGVFTNPIAIGKTEKYNIVVDGNNRLQALKNLGYEYIPCLCFQYSSIDLTNNIHYYSNDKVTRLSEFSIPTEKFIEFEKRSHADIIDLIERNVIIPNGETWHRLPFYIINLDIDLKNLSSDFNIKEYIKDRITSNNIRFYPNTVYTCNEW